MHTECMRFSMDLCVTYSLSDLVYLRSAGWRRKNMCTECVLLGGAGHAAADRVRADHLGASHARDGAGAAGLAAAPGGARPGRRLRQVRRGALGLPDEFRALGLRDLGTRPVRRGVRALGVPDAFRALRLRELRTGPVRGGRALRPCMT